MEQLVLRAHEAAHQINHVGTLDLEPTASVFHARQAQHGINEAGQAIAAGLNAKTAAELCLVSLCTDPGGDGVPVRYRVAATLFDGVSDGVAEIELGADAVETTTA